MVNLKDNISKTLSILKKNDRWIKTIEYKSNTKFCPDTYQSFSKTVDFLPKLFECKFKNDIMTIEYEHVEGTQLPFIILTPDNVRIMDKAMRFLAHNVVPNFLKFSETHDQIYFHYDIKFANMIMKDDKLFLIDIDSITWMNRKLFDDVETLYYV